MPDPALDPETSPERARQYVAEVMPLLLGRAAANLGLADDHGYRIPDPNPRAAHVALLSAAEVLEYMGPRIGEDMEVPLRAALARLERLFEGRHPDLAGVVPKRTPTGSLQEIVAAGWADPDDPS